MAKKGTSRKKMIVKVMKYELKYESGCADFNEMQNELWKLQRQTREVMNRTIQLCYHWSYVQADYCKQHGCARRDVKPCDVYETNATSLDGYIYQLFKDEYPNFLMANLIATLRKAHQKYDALLPDIQVATLLSPLSKKTSRLSSQKKPYVFPSAFRISDKSRCFAFPSHINLLILRLTKLRLPFVPVQLLKNPFLTISSVENMHSVKVSLCMKKRSGFFC